MTNWKLLGPIVLCQIHTDRMVSNGAYNANLLAEVDPLWLGPDGIVATVDGQAVLHAHHRQHPNKHTGETPRRFLPARLLSFGFTSHYEQMTEQFGAAGLGCAGEDLIVEYDQVVPLEQVQAGVQIRRDDRIVELVEPAVAKPCVPFTKFLLADPHASDDVVAPNRAFLDNGIRGFIVGLANQTDPIDIAVGDEFWVKA